MAHIQHVNRGTYVETDRADRGANMVARLINLVGFVIVALLAFRFVLSLFGANRGNGFADFIYSASHPFVAPFFGLFNYTPQFGISRFEFETLIAMIVYALITAILVRLVSVGRRDPL
jgi:uncharacterized protein YggT (Ycf19 family)